ncbi:MAG: cytochrome D1 domain-containing protein [Alphaproteobacteria bacterium]
MTNRLRRLALAAIVVLAGGQSVAAETRGTGDLGLVVERASGSVLIVETTGRTTLGRIEGLGDLSHASAVFSPDQRFAYVFGRDGGVSKIDLVDRALVARVVQAGNSIGGAILNGGRTLAVANYEPGGVRLLDAATLATIAEVPAETDAGRSKVVGLVDVPGDRLAFALYDAGAIWLADAGKPEAPVIERFADVGKQPYDGMVTPDGRWYVAGLYGEDGLAVLDLWHPEAGVRRVLDGYGHGEAPLPVYKMPHLEGWSATGDDLFIPAVGRHELLVVDRRTWREVGRVALAGQPVFAVSSPDGRRVWVNFALPDNGKVQIIDTASRAVVATLEPGAAVLHMEFTPRGEEVWVSARDDDKVVVYDADSLEVLAVLPAAKPSGIFFTARAHRIGQ